MNLTTEQMQAILKGAPDGAEYFDKSSNAYYKIEGEWSYLSRRPYEFWDVSVKAPYHVQNNTSGDFIKISDIRAELDSRYKAESKQRVDELNKSADEAIAALDTFNTAPRLSKTIDKSVCLSDSVKNDTQSDLSIKNDSQNISDDFKTKVKSLALSNGFKLKAQPDGFTDLNPYVYEFAAALVGDEKKLKPSIQAYFASDERGSIEQEQAVIETTHMKCALLRDSSLEKLQGLINENLANGWTLVGAVVSAGIHNDTFVATMMKVAGDE